MLSLLRVGPASNPWVNACKEGVGRKPGREADDPEKKDSWKRAIEDVLHRAGRVEQRVKGIVNVAEIKFGQFDT